MTSNEIPVHIALGSNLGNPENFLEEAREALRKLPLKKMKCSSVLKSSPLLGMAQTDYLNQLNEFVIEDVIQYYFAINFLCLILKCQEFLEYHPEYGPL